ncbi:Aspartate aminotransferase, cytoplasmic [Coemansia sp. RSA 990]|nr:Aspartate aminotransferase, cytoplasmic [Coemansia sp. RSA 990]
MPSVGSEPSSSNTVQVPTEAVSHQQNMGYYPVYQEYSYSYSPPLGSPGPFPGGAAQTALGGFAVVGGSPPTQYAYFAMGGSPAGSPQLVGSPVGAGHFAVMPTLPMHTGREEARGLDASMVDSRNVYIRNLDETCTDEKLKEMAEPWGEIESSKSIIDNNTGKCKGYGFVKYRTEEQAARAIEAFNAQGYTSTLARDSFKAKLKRLQDRTSTNVYISNLPADIDEDRLIELLQPHKVVSARILRDSRTGAHKGAGFARMGSRESALQVIDMLKGLKLPNAPGPLIPRIADSESQKMLKKQQAHVEMAGMQNTCDAFRSNNTSPLMWSPVLVYSPTGSPPLPPHLVPHEDARRIPSPTYAPGRMSPQGIYMPAPYAGYASPHPMGFAYFESVPQAPADGILKLSVLSKADTSSQKVDLGVGAYRDDKGKPWVLPVVRKAEARLHQDPASNHEYLGVGGHPALTGGAQTLIFGADSAAVQQSRVYTMQTISGTGANMVGAVFLRQFKQPQSASVYISKPTWGNHRSIFETAGHEVREYRYCDYSTLTLDIAGMLEDLRAAPRGQIIVLHACAHNPTGIDPTKEQWEQIADVMAEQGHFPFFDCAYQGFATGSVDDDAFAIRLFASRGFEMLVAESFAKNMGLYGERTGCLHAVVKRPELLPRVSSQLNRLSRATISTASAYGAKVAGIVLQDPELYQEWLENMQTMSSRIMEMRKLLRARLEELRTPGDWSHVTSQIGMFSFTGLTTEQVQKLRAQYHLYMTDDGRISVAGLNTANIDHVAMAIDAVVRNAKF